VHAVQKSSLVKLAFSGTRAVDQVVETFFWFYSIARIKDRFVVLPVSLQIDITVIRSDRLGFFLPLTSSVFLGNNIL